MIPTNHREALCLLMTTLAAGSRLYSETRRADCCVLLGCLLSWVRPVAEVDDQFLNVSNNVENMYKTGT